MSLMRTVLLKASQSAWLREQAPRYKFVRATVSRFMPGEQLEDSIRAAQSLADDGIKTIFTHLGENITSAAEAEQVRDQYLSVLDRIRSAGLAAEISVTGPAPRSWRSARQNLRLPPQPPPPVRCRR